MTRGLSASAFAADAQTAGAKGGAAQSSGARTAQQIAADIQKAGQDLGPLFATPQDLFEPAKRQAAAPKAAKPAKPPKAAKKSASKAAKKSTAKAAKKGTGKAAKKSAPSRSILLM